MKEFLVEVETMVQTCIVVEGGDAAEARAAAFTRRVLSPVTRVLSVSPWSGGDGQDVDEGGE